MVTKHFLESIIASYRSRRVGILFVLELFEEEMPPELWDEYAAEIGLGR